MGVSFLGLGGGGGGGAPSAWSWVTPSFSAGDFRGDGVGAWTVTAPGATDEFMYAIVGNHMWIRYALWVGAISTDTCDYLELKIPATKTPKYDSNPPGVAFDISGTGYRLGVIFIAKDATWLQLYPMEAYSPLATGNLSAFVAVDFEVN